VAATEEYRATVNLPGLRRGERAVIDPDSTSYLRRWIEGGYLVRTSSTRRKRRK
jgi:hypothetical protein